MGDQRKLFQSELLNGILSGNLEQIQEEISRLPREQILGSSDGELIECFVSKFSLEPIVLHKDKQTEDMDETEIDVSRDMFRDRPQSRMYRREPLLVPGIVVRVTIPFTGPHGLWNYQPHPSANKIPFGSIQSPRGDKPGFISYRIQCPADSNPGQHLKQIIEQQSELIDIYLESQGKMLENYHKKIPGLVKSELNKRRGKIDHLESVSKALNIPLLRRTGTPDITPIKIKRKLVKQLPPLPDIKREKSFLMDEEDFEDVLQFIRHVGKTFQTTPKTFIQFDEEGLRDIIVAFLNGHYEGKAQAEVFRNKGKTDILIEAENRSAFVGECKVWSGKAKLPDDINQLLGYLTWIDCKATLIIFNKNVGLSNSRTEIPAVFQSHELFRKTLKIPELGEWRFIMKSAKDETLFITVHVFLFHLTKEK